MDLPEHFCRRYNVKAPYMSGGMYRAIASPQLVVCMANAEFMSVLGTAGCSLDEVAAALDHITTHVPKDATFAANLIHQPHSPDAESAQVRLYREKNVRVIEASAFITVTPALVEFRLSDLRKDNLGDPHLRIIAKVSRPEVAEQFLRPPPLEMVRRLIEDGHLPAACESISQKISLADDICVEADSGGHTDAGNPLILLPPIIRLRDQIEAEYSYKNRIGVGLGGGVGTPRSAAAAFMMGADFVLTGSINQCTVEAGTSAKVKEMLSGMGVYDTAYAPAGDMFEMGAQIQVLKKGVLFPFRANKLYELWRNHESWHGIDGKTRTLIEEKFLEDSFERSLDFVKHRYYGSDAALLELLDNNPKQQMAAVFRTYFSKSSQAAINGDPGAVANYQIHTGPSLGAFNDWTKELDMTDWKSRHVDKLAATIMKGTAALL